MNMQALQTKPAPARQAGATPALQARFQPALQARFQDDELTAQADRLNNSPQAHQLKSKAAQLQTATAMPNVGNGLPVSLKAGVESLSGMSMDHVNVHYNSAKPAQLNAHAYTQGSDIHVAPGQERHVPHEAWHVVQQAQGRVQPTVQMVGIGVNDDSGLEAEADAMGARAASLGGGGVVASLKAATSGGPVAQLKHRTEIHYQAASLKWAADDVTPATAQQPVGVYSTAFLDPEDPVAGNEAGGAPGGVYSSPQYKALNHNISLVQGHLLNANLGGKSLAPNLFPITTSMNHAHSARVEEPAKDMLLKIQQKRVAEASTGQNDQPSNAGMASAHNRAISQQTAEADHQKGDDLGNRITAKFAGYGEVVARVQQAQAEPESSDHTIAIAAIKGASEVPGITMDQILYVAKRVAHYAQSPAIKTRMRAQATKDKIDNAADGDEVYDIYKRKIKFNKLYGPSVTGSTAATPDNIATAFSTYNPTEAAPGTAGNWGHARVYYAVKVVAPGLGGSTMRPGILDNTAFECTAYITTNDGVTRNTDENFLKTTIMDNSLNTQLGTLGFVANNYSVFQAPGAKESTYTHP